MSTVSQPSSSINSKWPPAATASVEDLLPEVHYGSHAVIAYILDVNFGDVRVKNDRGHHLPGGSDDLLASPRHADVRRGAMVRIAGDVAEYVATCTEPIGAVVMAFEIAEWPSDGPTSFDRWKAHQGVYDAFGREFVNAMFDIVRDTFALVIANWGVIEYVARALHEYGDITSDQLHTMICDVVMVPDDVVIGGATNVD